MRAIILTVFEILSALFVPYYVGKISLAQIVELPSNMSRIECCLVFWPLGLAAVALMFGIGLGVYYTTRANAEFVEKYLG